jgi:hypothetical protein
MNLWNCSWISLGWRFPEDGDFNIPNKAIPIGGLNPSEKY